jgi:integrase
VSGHLKAMVQFSLLTGLREANVTGLEWSQVDLIRRVAWIHPDQAKAGKAIGVALNDDAVQIIKQQQGLNATRVFTYKGRPVKKANKKAWREALKRVGIENFRWHDLRHTCTSRHINSCTSRTRRMVRYTNGSEVCSSCP